MPWLSSPGIYYGYYHIFGFHFRPDPETEERAQRAIEQFFASNMIAPSPWSDPKARKSKKAVLATPSNQAGKQNTCTKRKYYKCNIDVVQN